MSRIFTSRQFRHEVLTRPRRLRDNRPLPGWPGTYVVRVGQIGLSRADDSGLLATAQQQGRILVTRDRDFGGLVFVQVLGMGVIYLRILSSTQHSVHKELERVLSTYSENELMKAFVVIEPGRHRFRKRRG